VVIIGSEFAGVFVLVNVHVLVLVHVFFVCLRPFSTTTTN